MHKGLLIVFKLSVKDAFYEAAYIVMNNFFLHFFALKVSVLTLSVFEIREVQYLNRKNFF